MSATQLIGYNTSSHVKKKIKKKHFLRNNWHDRNWQASEGNLMFLHLSPLSYSVI